MQKETQNEKKPHGAESCNPREKGTSDLIVGAGIGAYGTASFAATGAICPACVIFAPALLGLGLYKRVQFNKNQKQRDVS